VSIVGGRQAETLLIMRGREGRGASGDDEDTGGGGRFSAFKKRERKLFAHTGGRGEKTGIYFLQKVG